MTITMVEELVPTSSTGYARTCGSTPELAAAGPAAVLPCVVDHAVDDYGPVLGTINEVVEEVEEAVFTGVGPSRPSGSTTSPGRCWSCAGR
jgi:hypothetical protein